MKLNRFRLTTPFLGFPCPPSFSSSFLNGMGASNVAAWHMENAQLAKKMSWSHSSNPKTLVPKQVKKNSCSMLFFMFFLGQKWPKPWKGMTLGTSISSSRARGSILADSMPCHTPRRIHRTHRAIQRKRPSKGACFCLLKQRDVLLRCQFVATTSTFHRGNSCERRGNKPFVVVTAGSMQEKMSQGLIFAKTCKNGQLISVVRCFPLLKV